MFSVIGGKLTTCRSLAQEAARTILERLELQLTADSTERIIPGGEAYPPTATELAAEQARLAQALGFSLAQIRAVWNLCGTETAVLLGTNSGAEWLDADDRDNLCGTSLPLRFVRWVIRHEAVARLADLVERRLMLLYQPQLSAETLRQLAELLADAAILPRGQIESEVQACIVRLQTHFGKRVIISGAR
jgi:glycerol-3-phosphate dehydrogenase